MNQSARDIEREVEASRASVEETVEALKDKMSIGQIVDEASRFLGPNGGSEVLTSLGAQVRANPLPLALVGIGLAWLMSGRGPGTGGTAGGQRNDYARNRFADANRAPPHDQLLAPAYLVLERAHGLAKRRCIVVACERRPACDCLLACREEIIKPY